ncbi:unnamed protein product [Rotaria sp. Silwood2]|nr:unnamed protein product [Rotaria sp. Silwood2]
MKYGKNSIRRIFLRWKVAPNKSVNNDILLIYIYAGTHSHAYGNLKYFIEKCVRQGDHVDYYFILQQVDNKPLNESDMPLLTSKTAYYIQHENKCYDFGTIGWFFDHYTIGNPWKNNSLVDKTNRKINLNKYKYFIFMNSSIRGPFFPPYFIELVSKSNINYYWYSIFTNRINNYVKLVGCTISCETVPHVQSYLLVTDLIGLSILLKPGNWGGAYPEGIFTCYPTKDHVSLYSELPSSNRILESGYMIDSLLTKYQHINFSEPHNKFCNSNKNPFINNAFQGTSLEPYEVVFVKYNDFEWTKDSRGRAQLYEKWNNDIKLVNRSSW